MVSCDKFIMTKIDKWQYGGYREIWGQRRMGYVHLDEGNTCLKDILCEKYLDWTKSDQRSSTSSAGYIRYFGAGIWQAFIGW